jgi:metal iron transporter
MILTTYRLYQACGILGATVMPHSLYLGSGLVQARLKEFDLKQESFAQNVSLEDDLAKYRPSLSAIRHCLKLSIFELVITLFTFALFVNSAILIVSGASLSNLPVADTEDADLFSIHDLLARAIGPAGGTIFALALLLSGTSAGIVCTMAGQIVSEGQLSWSIKPWMRRLITRGISIIPSIIIAGVVGRAGLGKALEATQVALSIILPIVSIPLLWFTCNSKIMKVHVDESERHMVRRRKKTNNARPSTGTETPGSNLAARNTNTPAAALPDDTQYTTGLVMRNSWPVTILAVLIWVVLALMNVLLLVQFGRGTAGA